MAFDLGGLSASAVGTGSTAAAFPDATTTGVPAGTTLQAVPGQVSSGPGWTWNTGGWVDITGDDTVFDGFSVASSVNVMGNGCTISNCSISNRGQDNGIGIRHGNNTTITDCTIVGSDTPGSADDPNRLTCGIKDVYGDGVTAIIRRVNLSGCSGGIAIDDGLIDSCYIHDMSKNSTDHVDCLQSFGVGTATHTIDGDTWVGLKIHNNRLVNPFDQTACILISTTLTSPQGNKLVTGNLMAGGGYCVNGPGGDTAGDSHDLVFENNQFSTQVWPNGGSFGPVAHIHIGTGWPGNTWIGNVWADGPSAGQTVNL